MKALDDLFRLHSVKLDIFIGREIKSDPDYDTTTPINYNPIFIDAIDIDQLASDKIQWKFQGIKVAGAKVFLINKEDLDTIKLSQKIKYDGDTYYAYRENTNKVEIKKIGQIGKDEYVLITLWRK